MILSLTLTKAEVATWRRSNIMPDHDHDHFSQSKVFFLYNFRGLSYPLHIEFTPMESVTVVDRHWADETSHAHPNSLINNKCVSWLPDET
jgi:hypothetical protein